MVWKEKKGKLNRELVEKCLSSQRTNLEGYENGHVGENLYDQKHPNDVLHDPADPVRGEIENLRQRKGLDEEAWTNGCSINRSFCKIIR